VLALTAIWEYWAGIICRVADGDNIIKGLIKEAVQGLARLGRRINANLSEHR
jgi:hypothetical protein